MACFKTCGSRMTKRAAQEGVERAALGLNGGGASGERKTRAGERAREWQHIGTYSGQG